MDSERIQVRLSHKLYKELKVLAKADHDRDLSTYVRILIEEALMLRKVNDGKQQ